MDAASAAAVASAIIAAIAALISLWQAWEFRKQISDDRKHRLAEAAIAQSPYLSETYQLASRALDDAFGPLAADGEPLSESHLATAFEDRSLFHSWRVMLNHWGRLAVAYYSQTIDRKVARQMYIYGFVFFMRRYRAYFDRNMSKEHYRHLIDLFNEWDSSALMAGSGLGKLAQMPTPKHDSVPK